MDTVLSAVRSAIFQDRSWASSGASLNRKVNSAINRALREIAGDVPEALQPEEYHTRIFTPVDGGDGSVDATLKATADPKVLEFVIVAPSTWTPVVNGSWDGVMWMKVTDPDGRVRRRQSREWWLVGATYYVSVNRPWRNAIDAAMAFKIYQPTFFLPGNTIDILGPISLFTSSSQLMTQISSGSARRSSLPDVQTLDTGPPSEYWRGRMFQMPSPKLAPTFNILSVSNQDVTATVAWNGPIQEGQFRFCYTYVWGRTDEEVGKSQTGVVDPVWESAPSPISAVFDHNAQKNLDTTGVTFQGPAINMIMDNPDEILDFVGKTELNLSAIIYPPLLPLRFGKSGFRIRIYVARDDLYSTNGPAATALGVVAANRRYNRVTTDGKFFLLSEIDPMDLDPVANTAPFSMKRISSFTWTGALPVPDFERPLRKITGYYAYHMYPLPDQDYDLDMSILRQPHELVHDNDAIPVKQEAFEAFLELCLAYMSRLDGVDQVSETKHRALYKSLLGKYRKQHGDSGGIVLPVSWVVTSYGNRLGTMTDA